MVSDLTPGANAGITTFLELFAPTSFPEGGTVSGTPVGFSVATDTADLSATPVDIPNGTAVGSLTAKVQLAVNALGAKECFAPVVIPFAMVDSTVDQTGATVGASPADQAWAGNFDGDSDGLPDAVTKWPTFLDAHLANVNPGGAPPVPIARYHGQILVAPPSPTNLELVVFAAGSHPDYPASMGGITISYLEDSLAAPAPSSISMNCTAPAPTVFTTTFISGASVGEAILFPNPSLPTAGGSLVQFDPNSGLPFPGAEICDGNDSDSDGTVDEGCGFLLRENPSTAGSYLFSITSTSGRDTDNDGIENDLDKCPLNVDANATALGAPFPFGLGYNARWPAPFAFPQPEDPDDDNLPSSCDPSPFVPSFTGPFGVDEDIFSEGFTPPFTQFYSNGQDDCPLVGDPSQAKSEIPAINIGPDNDNMGDACDPHPTVSDGHAHRDWGVGPVCIGGTDDDGDGWCASDDPDDDDASLQTEDIAFERTCGDGADNDGDGDTDLDDTGCQLPNHDLRWNNPRINGSLDVVCGQISSYSVRVKNTTADPETFRIAFLIDTTADGLADGISATAQGLISDGLVAGTDKVGSINHDSGGYPAAQLAPLHSAVTDLELEAFATADVTVNGNATRPVKLELEWNCTGDPVDDNVDATISVDICHVGDPTQGLLPPLLPLGDDCGFTGSDGGQDRADGNDATLTKTIDVE